MHTVTTETIASAPREARFYSPMNRTDQESNRLTWRMTGS